MLKALKCAVAFLENIAEGPCVSALRFQLDPVLPEINKSLEEDLMVIEELDAILVR